MGDEYVINSDEYVDGPKAKTILFPTEEEVPVVQAPKVTEIVV